MRRSITVLLMLVLGIGPLLAAVPQADDPRLPACCRRLGAHHCAMTLATLSRAFDGRAVWSAPSACSDYPTAAPALVLPLFAIVPASPVAREISAVQSTAAQLFAKHSKDSVYAHAERGPPLYS